ncbi:MAG: glycosyl hydrolase family 18 protein [Minisyncoccia bacterium]
MLYISSLLLLCASLFSQPAEAALGMTIQGVTLPPRTIVDSGTELHVSAWVPYWRKENGTAEAQKAMIYIDTFSPFMYEVDSTGAIASKADLKLGNWSSLLQTARLSGKKITPSIIWLKGGEIHTVLSDSKKRKKHIDSIVTIMKGSTAYVSGGYDGIDIDYEGKNTETRAGFSAFLTELKAELKKIDKSLICTLETRNANRPYEEQIQREKEYVNDYKVINSVCDVVRVMTYDQRNADPVLGKLHETELYMPVADVAWVQKVLKTLVKFIDPKKIELGIPTYGHAYKITKKGTGWSYERMRSLTYVQAMERARLYGGSPTRGASGELTFTYKIPTGEFAGEYLAVLSDAQAVRSKIELAERMGIRGVALFALYGENDPQLPHDL